MGDRKVVNICFHGIGVPARELEPGESRYWVTEQQFEAILDEIASWPSVQISFDDGNQSDIEFGLPALVERGLTATFFALAGRLGSAGSLGPGDIVDLGRAGMTIGTHGMNHRSWRGMDADTRQAELVDARVRIAEIADCHIDQAALPLGQYDRRLLSHLRKLGYRSVHTSDRRMASLGSWIQPRFSVRVDDTAQSMRDAVQATLNPKRRALLEATGLAKRLR